MDEENDVFAYAMWVSCLQLLISFMKASVELNLFDIISKSKKPMTAFEIALHLPKHNPARTPALLDRTLRFLATFSLLDCTTESIASITPAGESMVQRYYALSRAGKYFVKDNLEGSLVPIFWQTNDPVFLNIRQKLTHAIIEGMNPFEATYGSPMYEVMSVHHPESGKLFNEAMAETSTVVMTHLIQKYKGFDSIKVLVDVGGGHGACLKTIISANPHIKGINFDLPHVVEVASPFPGITHVGGDFMVGIPKGDAIMLKSILHNWEDETCIKLLKSCYESIPENGKLLVIEMILPNSPTSSNVDKFACMLDCYMLYALEAKERTEEEFHHLGRASGFSEVEVICFAAGYWVIEFRK